MNSNDTVDALVGLTGIGLILVGVVLKFGVAWALIATGVAAVFLAVRK